MKMSFFRLLQLAPLVSIFFLLALPDAKAEKGQDSIAAMLAVMESQSPVDIRSENAIFQELPALKFDFSSGSPLSVINNGSPDEEKTIRANVPLDAGSLKFSGNEWDLAQFHFHAPSEHLLNGHASDMEMHLVFSDPHDHLLVVSRWIEEGAFNSALDPIFSHLPQTTTEQLNIDSFNLNTLLPGNLESFRYTGSLTTPPFTEGVNWIQLAQPLNLSGGQIDAFTALFPDGNTREAQPLNGRDIVTDVPGFATTDPALEADALVQAELGLTPYEDALEIQLLNGKAMSAGEPGLITAVPEPESYVMLLAGLGLMGFIVRRRVAKESLTGSSA
ncbi:MAG: carbonic anhydrase family protein [Nitrosospira sp.]